MKKRIQNDQSGFTIIEMIISVALSAILAVTLLTVTLYMMGDLARARITAEMAIESQRLLHAMVDDARLADSLSTTNSNADANAPSGGWVTNDPSNILIIDTPAINSSRDIIYDSASGYPYKNEVIYFASGSSMYRRTLANSSANGNAIKTSCPASIATATCPADKLYTQYLQDLSFTFYDQNDATTANAASARSVQITVTVRRKIYGRYVQFTNTIRTTMRNQ